MNSCLSMLYMIFVIKASNSEQHDKQLLAQVAAFQVVPSCTVLLTTHGV